MCTFFVFSFLEHVLQLVHLPSTDAAVRRIAILTAVGYEIHLFSAVAHPNCGGDLRACSHWVYELKT